MLTIIIVWTWGWCLEHYHLWHSHCESSLGPLQWMCRHQVAASMMTELQAWTFESAVRLPLARHSPVAIRIITQPWDTHFAIPRRVEGWVDLGARVMVCSALQKLCIAVVFIHFGRYNHSLYLLFLWCVMFCSEQCVHVRCSASVSWHRSQPLGTASSVGATSQRPLRCWQCRSSVPRRSTECGRW